jgi:hypothetical protein
VSHGQILAYSLGLLILELNHLKWIWWEHWSCRKCGAKHRHCACSSKWVMYL